MKTTFALTILRIINLGFESQSGRNPDMISLANRYGNKIYIENKSDSVSISAYKSTRRCYNKSIVSDGDIELVAVDLKELLRCDDIQ